MRSRMNDARIAALVMTLALAGCVTVPPAEDSGTTSGLPRPPATTTRSETTTREDGDSATTSDERRAVLGRRLDDSLDEFDKTLQDEQRRTAEARDTQKAETSEGGAGSAGSSARREGDLRSERGAGNDNRDEGGEQRDRGTSGVGSGAPDRGLPSGEDDDIVARRLRRAAEQETDPELKEKLWKEYADYKRNVRGGG